MMSTRNFLKIELRGDEADDGRILFKSPDLDGFYFIVNAGEDPIAAMEPTLMEFIGLYLKAEIRKIEPTQTPRQFRRRMLDILPRPSRDYSVIAEVAVA